MMESNNYDGYKNEQFADLFRQPYITLGITTTGFDIEFLYHSGSINKTVGCCFGYRLSKEMTQKLLYNMAMRGLFLQTYTGYVIGVR
jgi:hypothetical protein